MLWAGMDSIPPICEDDPKLEYGTVTRQAPTSRNSPETLEDSQPNVVITNSLKTKRALWAWLLVCFSVSYLHNIPALVFSLILGTLLIICADGTNKRCGRQIHSRCIAVRGKRRRSCTRHEQAVCDAWHDYLRGPLRPWRSRLQQLYPLPPSHQ